MAFVWGFYGTCIEGLHFIWGLGYLGIVIQGVCGQFSVCIVWGLWGFVGYNCLIVWAFCGLVGL